MAAAKAHPTTESFGQRLARLRRGRGLTQAQLAQKVGLGQSNVSDYERDVFQANAQMILKLAEALDVSTDELLNPRPRAEPHPVISRKVLRRMIRIEQLPKRDQEALLRTVDKFLTSA